MDEIIKTSRNHLIGSIILVTLLISGITIYHLVSKPPLFIPPPESEKTKLEDAILNSENIDALKKTCAIFAKCRDEAAIYRNHYAKHTDQLFKLILGSLVLMFCSFAYGYFGILKKAKKVRDDNQNAL